MQIYFTIVSFITGITLGSFYNVCIYRIPEKLSVVKPPSHCYNCNTRLKSIDLIPILSWTLLKGKCRYCKTKISPRYALVELLTGILFIIVYINFGSTLNTLYYMFLISLLIIITFIDLDHYIIPDELLIIGSIISIIVNLLGYGVGIKNGLLGALICGGGVLLVIYLIELLIKKEVMGGGDIKLFAMLGLFLGVKLGALTILLSVYVGAIYGIISIAYSKIKKQEYNSMIPYGPFISVAAFIVLLYGNDIINWYLGIF